MTDGQLVDARADYADDYMVILLKRRLHRRYPRGMLRRRSTDRLAVPAVPDLAVRREDVPVKRYDSKGNRLLQ